jgi:hypothetical protein
MMGSLLFTKNVTATCLMEQVLMVANSLFIQCNRTHMKVAILCVHRVASCTNPTYLSALNYWFQNPSVLLSKYNPSKRI